MTTGYKVETNVATDYCVGGFAVTPHDTNELAIHCRKIYVGGAGAVKITALDGSVVVFTGVLANTILPIGAKIIWSTGTAATNMTAMY